MNGCKVPENVYANKGAGLRFRVDHAYELDNLYQQTRSRADDLKKGDWYPHSWTRENSIRVDMHPIMAEGEME